MSLKKETHNIQSQLAEYCKTGIMVEIEGARQDRLHHYRRLTYNIVKEALVTAYPIAYKSLKENQWMQMVDEYYVRHKMNTPLVWKMPYEFYEFCIEANYADKFELPYLEDLLYFEWIEIELHTMPDKEFDNYNDTGDLMGDKLVITPEYELLSFDYPVHKFKGDELLDKKGNYFVLIFRKHDTGAVRFINLSSYFAVVLQLLIEEGLTFKKAIQKASMSFGVDYDKSIQYGLSFANDLIAQGFILGFNN